MAARKYEQRLRKERAEETRRRIIEAVKQRLRRAPGAPVSLDDVARDAQVSRSTIYVVFGSRAGLFDAVAAEIWTDTGVVLEQNDDAREQLRAGLRRGTELYARIRDVARGLYSAAALDPDALAGAIGRRERDRARGIERFVPRLIEQGVLREEVTAEQAADILWMLTGFETFDLLYTGRKLSVDQIADLLIGTAERTLCR